MSNDRIEVDTRRFYPALGSERVGYPLKDVDVIVKGSEENLVYQVKQKGKKVWKKRKFIGVTIGVKFKDIKTQEICGDYIHIPEDNLYDLVQELLNYLQRDGTKLPTEKDIKLEGFDDGKDLVLLMEKQKRRGLKTDETKRLKEIKLKYNIPTYGQDL